MSAWRKLSTVDNSLADNGVEDIDAIQRAKKRRKKKSPIPTGQESPWGSIDDLNRTGAEDSDVVRSRRGVEYLEPYISIDDCRHDDRIKTCGMCCPCGSCGHNRYLDEKEDPWKKQVIFLSDVKYTIRKGSRQLGQSITWRRQGSKKEEDPMAEGEVDQVDAEVEELRKRMESIRKNLQ